MPAWRRSTPSAQDQPIGLTTRRRFLRAAGVGTAGAVVAAGAVAGQAGAAPEGLAVAIPTRRRLLRARPQGADGAAAVQAVSGPLTLHTISPQRYVDTRFDGGGPFPPQGSTGDAFVFDFGLPDYFGGGVPNEVPPDALAVTFNVTVTGGTSGGNLRAFPADSAVIPLVANVNWSTGQTVGNFAIVAAASDADFDTAVAFHNASTRGSVHVIVDIFGYFSS
jgi:hypothetical protein